MQKELFSLVKYELLQKMLATNHHRCFTCAQDTTPHAPVLS